MQAWTTVTRTRVLVGLSAALVVGTIGVAGSRVATGLFADAPSAEAAAAADIRAQAAAMAETIGDYPIDWSEPAGSMYEITQRLDHQVISVLDDEADDDELSWEILIVGYGEGPGLSASNSVTAGACVRFTRHSSRPTARAADCALPPSVERVWDLTLEGVLAAGDDSD